MAGFSPVRSCDVHYPDNAGLTHSPEVSGLGSRRAVYVDSPIYARRAYGTQHPLAIARTETVFDLCRTLGWLPDAALVISAAADACTLRRFHDESYLAALEEADRTSLVTRATRERYHIGTMENPLFEGVFQRAATTVGGSIMAAELALAGHLAFHPAGGTHHGRAQRASGFCYLNDPVFAILRLVDEGLDRILYVDLDAHHGDGVEAAFKADPRVSLCSIHEADRWPYTGGIERWLARRICNLPVPKACSDKEFEYLIDAVVLPFAAAAEPQGIVVTCGADALAGDPLSAMRLSNTCLWRSVQRIVGLSDVVVVLGGGGYNPWTLARCWAGLWATLVDRDIPARLPAEATDILASLRCDLVDEEDIDPEWLEYIADETSNDGIRDEVVALSRECKAHWRHH